jgi:glycosyltransferase involved in cell wall biosynthesis
MKTIFPLRVLHVTEAACAGVGGHMLDLAEGLEQRGCENHLIYSDRRIDAGFGSRVAKLSVQRRLVVAMRRMPHWSDWNACRQISRYIERWGPFQIVHGHSTKAGGLTRLKRIAGAAAVVYTPNGLFTMNPGNGFAVSRVVRWVERRLAPRAAAIVAVSPEEREHMLQIGLPADRVQLIPNGLRPQTWPDRCEVRRELKLADDVLAIGFLGRMAPQKDPLLMIEAFARLRPTADRPVRLLMVGEGPLERDARRLCQSRGVADRVDWLGYRTAPQVMPAFDVFAMPSRYEGMPYVLMEAVANGLPAVATKVGGASLSIANGVNGYLVASEDPAEFALALQRLVDCPERRADFSVAAREKAAEFAIDAMIDRTLQLYCKLVHQAPMTARAPEPVSVA